MRKRKTKYTWFPNIGFQGEDAENDGNGFPFSVPVSDNVGVINTNIFELIPDFSESQPATTTDNLADFIANEYILKRIVGKIFANCDRSAPAGPNRIIFGAGFFIARADEAAPQLPVGAGTAAEINLNYGVLNNQNIREPWIWRRVWCLQNPGIPVLQGTIGTFSAGSVADGPHIDAKSARRVGQDERLFLSVATQTFEPAQTPGSGLEIEGYLDYRVLGALRKAKNKSSF